MITPPFFRDVTRLSAAEADAPGTPARFSNARRKFKSLSGADGNDHDVAPLAYLLILQAVDSFVFPHAARIGSDSWLVME